MFGRIVRSMAGPDEALAKEDGEGAVGRVRAWLRKTGHALEMRTAAALKAEGLQVESGRHYVDTDGETLRELDVVARGWNAHSGSGDSPWIELDFVVECKASKKSPWVGFLGDERLQQDHDVVAKLRVDSLGMETDIYGNAMSIDVTRLRGLHNAPLLYSTEPFAYAIAEASGAEDGGGSQAYRAVRQVTSAVDGLARDLCERVSRPVLRLSVPVVITSAPVVSCRLGENGNELVEEVPKLLLVTRLRPAAELSAVWVMHEDYLENFAQEARRSVDALSLADR